MGSLTSERIDSTNTTISLVQPLHSVQNTFCFLTDKGFCSCLWAFFLFFINSTFNLGPEVIACTKGVIFIYLFFRVFQASEGKREASEEPLSPSRVSGAPRPLGACLRRGPPPPPKKKQKITPVMQATGAKQITSILVVSKGPRNWMDSWWTIGHGIAAKGLRHWRLVGDEKFPFDTFLEKSTLPT